MKMPNLLNVYSHIDVSGDCWLWTASTNEKGYGMYTWGYKENKRTVRIHRFIYQIFYGPIHDGLTIDHLCRERRCVKPTHLEVVTHFENCRRRPPTIPKQYCPVGHDTFIVGRSSGGCMECRRIRNRLYMRTYKKKGVAS